MPQTYQEVGERDRDLPARVVGGGLLPRAGEHLGLEHADEPPERGRPRGLPGAPVGAGRGGEPRPRRHRHRRRAAPAAPAPPAAAPPAAAPGHSLARASSERADLPLPLDPVQLHRVAGRILPLGRRPDLRCRRVALDRDLADAQARLLDRAPASCASRPRTAGRSPAARSGASGRTPCRTASRSRASPSPSRTSPARCGPGPRRSGPGPRSRPRRRRRRGRQRTARRARPAQRTRRLYAWGHGSRSRPGLVVALLPLLVDEPRGAGALRGHPPHRSAHRRARRSGRRDPGSRGPVPGLHARPAAPRLHRGARAADRGPLGAASSPARRGSRPAR